MVEQDLRRPCLVLLRGGPASGKTTVGRLIRDKKRKVISIAFNSFHRFISSNPRQNKDLTFEAILSLTEFFLKKNFSVIIEELFLFKDRVDLFFAIRERRCVSVYLFELEVTLTEVLKRASLSLLSDRAYRESARRLLELIRTNPDSRAVKIDTCKYSPQEIADLILNSVMGTTS